LDRIIGGSYNPLDAEERKYISVLIGKPNTIPEPCSK
jgi:hypothetical protein